MSGATLTIDADEREALHGLLLRRLTLLPEFEGIFAKRDGFTITDLYLALGDELRLFDEVGLGFLIERSSVELTIPRESLVAVLKRLRRDARRAPCEVRHEREPQESTDERWQRFRRGVEACEALLARLDDSGDRYETMGPSEEHCPASAADGQELRAYTPVDDILILAAAERAALHEQEETVLTSVLTEHLGFAAVPATNKHLWPRLEELRREGLLTVAERRGEPFWGLTTVGRERLEAEREAGRAGELPESPQHRAWWHARVEAAVRIEGFKEELILAAEEADRLINQYRPVMSEEWFALSERLRRASWCMASATYCLTEWPEPDDAMPDLDENPGPHPGRRTTSAWNRSTESKEGS